MIKSLNVNRRKQMLEIILVIMAWKKGWRWKALLPPLVAFSVILIIGGAVAESGGDPVSVLIPCALGELITLGIMVSRAPSKTKVSKESKVDLTPVASDGCQPEHQKV